MREGYQNLTQSLFGRVLAEKASSVSEAYLAGLGIKSYECSIKDGVVRRKECVADEESFWLNGVIGVRKRR